MDMMSYVLGYNSGEKNVALTDGTDYTFADDGEGNVTIAATTADEEEGE